MTMGLTDYPWPWVSQIIHDHESQIIHDLESHRLSMTTSLTDYPSPWVSQIIHDHESHRLSMTTSLTDYPWPWVSQIIHDHESQIIHDHESLSQIIHHHESHRLSMTMSLRLSMPMQTFFLQQCECVMGHTASTGHVDHDLEKHCQKEKYWLEEVVRRLADRGLSFIGLGEHIGSRQNINVLGVMELIGELKPCLAKHLDELVTPFSIQIIANFVSVLLWFARAPHSVCAPDMLRL